MVIVVKSNVSKGFVKAAIILCFLYAVVYFISFSKWKNSHFDDIDITYRETDDKTGKIEDKTDKTDKTDEKDEKEYKAIYDKVNYELLENHFGEEFQNIYYNGADFSSTYYIYLAIINIVKDNARVNCNLKMDIDESKVRFEINSLFGSVNYDNQSFKTKNGYLEITYNKDQNKYSVKLNKCSGFDYSNGGIKNIYSGHSLVGNYLYIYEHAIYLDYSQSVNGNLVFNYHSGVSKDSKIIGNDINKLDMDKLDTYVYTFEKEKEGYKLVSIKKQS